MLCHRDNCGADETNLKTQGYRQHVRLQSFLSLLFIWTGIHSLNPCVKKVCLESYNSISKRMVTLSLMPCIPPS